MVSRCSEANFGVQQARSAGPAHTGAWPGVGRRDGARGHGVSESAGVAERRLGGSKACNAESALKKKKKKKNGKNLNSSRQSMMAQRIVFMPLKMQSGVQDRRWKVVRL